MSASGALSLPPLKYYAPEGRTSLRRRCGFNASVVLPEAHSPTASARPCDGAKVAASPPSAGEVPSSLGLYEPRSVRVSQDATGVVYVCNSSRSFDGRSVYVTSTDGKYVAVIDTASRNIVSKTAVI